MPQGLRLNMEAPRETMLANIEPDWKVEETFGKLQDGPTLYSRGAPSNPAQREARFAAFNAALAGFAAALDGAEVGRCQIVGMAFCADQVSNPFADLLRRVGCRWLVQSLTGSRWIDASASARDRLPLLSRATSPFGVTRCFKASVSSL